MKASESSRMVLAHWLYQIHQNGNTQLTAAGRILRVWPYASQDAFASPQHKSLIL